MTESLLNWRSEMERAISEISAENARHLLARSAIEARVFHAEREIARIEAEIAALPLRAEIEALTPAQRDLILRCHIDPNTSQLTQEKADYQSLIKAGILEYSQVQLTEKGRVILGALWARR